VQNKVKQRKLNLPEGLHAALEIFGSQHLLVKLAGERSASVNVRRHVLQDIPFPAEVLHELTGELNRIPLNAADTGDVMLVDSRQHVVQAVAELMEQGNHIVMRQ